MAVRENSIKASTRSSRRGPPRAGLRKLDQQLEERTRALANASRTSGRDWSRSPGSARKRRSSSWSTRSRTRRATRLRRWSATSRSSQEERRPRGKKIVAMAIQRIAAEVTAESSVVGGGPAVDEMKGRIIGRKAATSARSKRRPASTSSSTTPRYRGRLLLRAGTARRSAASPSSA